MSSQIVLCIPRVFPNINEQRIRRIFDELDLGVIGRIDMVSTTNKNGEHFNRVFVHFTAWYKNPNADTAFTRLHEGNEIKIIYDGPWFWKVSLYRKKETHHQANHHHQQHIQQRPVAARLDFQEPNPTTRRPVSVPALPIAPALSAPPPMSASAPAQQARSRALPSSPAATTTGQRLNVVPALKTPPRKLNYKQKTPQAPKKQPRQPNNEPREKQNHPGPMKLSDLDLEDGEIANTTSP
jgi:hypothetical protein